MSVKVYENNGEQVSLDPGVYYVEGMHSAVRDSLIASVVHEAEACAVSYENFSKALGLPLGSENCDVAFRGAVDALLGEGVPVVIIDVQTLDQADIALYGFDGPSQMVEIREGMKVDG